MLISDKYEVLEQIGLGGMGTVYKVRHRGLETELALKVLARELGEDPDAHRRFQREARVVARLDHPNIVRVLDIDRDPQRDMAYIVMELIDGVTLEQRLRADGALPLAEALDVAIQVGRALAHAHAHTPPIVHRDVKPANVMLEAGSGRAVVMDFGIAKEVGDSDLTRTGQTMGTVKYSPPEQIRGEPLTPKADVYALGMVLYEIVTGRQIFAGLEKAAVVGRLLYEPDEILPEFDPDTPAALQALIRRAIAKSADARPEMAALVGDLERCRRALGATPPPPAAPPAAADAPETVVRAAPRQRPPTDGWDDAPDDEWVLGEAESPRRRDHRPRRRSRVPLVVITVLAVAAAGLGAGLYGLRGGTWQRSLYLPPALLVTSTVSPTPTATPTSTATPTRTPRPTATPTRSASATAVATLVPAVVAVPAAAPSAPPPVPLRTPTARPVPTATPLPRPRLRARTPAHERVALLDTETRVFAAQVEVPGAPEATLRYAWALDGHSAGSAAIFELRAPTPGPHEVSVIITTPSGDRVLRRWMVDVETSDAPGRAAPTVLARSLDDTVSRDRTTLRLAGTVENVDQRPAENVVVELDALDARDAVVLHRTAVPLPQPLAPGRTGTFELALPNLPEIERFRIRVLSH